MIAVFSEISILYLLDKLKINGRGVSFVKEKSMNEADNERLSLNYKERILLANQYRILEVLCPDEADSYRERYEVVAKGFELHYSELHVDVVRVGLTYEECEEVMDILEMFSDLKFGYDNLTDKANIDYTNGIEFKGFYANTEGPQLVYAKFLIHQQERWQELIADRPRFDLNSHANLLGMYRRMVLVWNGLKDTQRLGMPGPLSLEKIKKILEARNGGGGA